MSLKGLPLTTPALTHQPEVIVPETATTAPPHGEGLDEIRHQVRMTGPTVSLLPPVRGHASEGLLQIEARAEPAAHGLDPLSGKSARIRGELPDALNTRLDHDLARMTRQERKAVKSLLHFGIGTRGNTTVESRVQIRTILTSFIAQGGSMADARLLKTQLKGVEADKLPKILAAMNSLADPACRLPETQNQRLQDRIEHSDPGQKERIAALLATSLVSCRATSVGPQADVRTILAGCLAQGMDLGEAERLKLVLLDLDPQKLAEMRRDMILPDAKAFGVLSKYLLDRGHPDRDRFDQVRMMIQSFPPDLARAGMTEHVDDNTALARDVHGRLDVAHARAAFVRIGGEAPYQTLSQDQRAQVTTAFTNLCSTRYGRVGLPLDLMGAFRAENNRRREALPPEEPISLGDFARTWQPDGAATMARYGRGDCMNIAQALVADLARQGITAYLGGEGNSRHMMQRHRDNAIPLDGDLNTMGIQHTDVLVPYRTETGEERVIVINPGQGHLPPEKYFQDLSIDAPGVSKSRVGVSQPLDPGRIQKDQLGFLTNLLFDNRAWGEPTSVVAGIDIVDGTVLLSRAATERFRAAHGADFAPEKTALVFNYRDALAHPEDRVTVRVWNEDSQAYENREITKLESLTLFLRGIQAQFNQPDEFVTNTLTLMAHEREYQSEVLWPSTRALNRLV